MNIQNTIEDVCTVSNKYLKLNDDTISNDSDYNSHEIIQN